MSLLSPSRCRREEERTLPLINIVFLLLIFFMIAGQIDGFDPFDVTPPASSRQDPLDDSEIVIHVAADGRIALDGQEVSSDGLPDAVTARRADRPDAMVVMKADGQLAAATMVTLMEALHAAGVARVTLIAVAAPS